MVTVTVRVGACVRTPSPPGMLYDPNMVEEQNEQHKPLPKRIQEHASALVDVPRVFRRLVLRGYEGEGIKKHNPVVLCPCVDFKGPNVRRIWRYSNRHVYHS